MNYCVAVETLNNVCPTTLHQSIFLQFTIEGFAIHIEYLSRFIFVTVMPAQSSGNIVVFEVFYGITEGKIVLNCRPVPAVGGVDRKAAGQFNSAGCEIAMQFIKELPGQS